MERPGKNIVIEGTDATGKTTAANLLAARAYEEGQRIIRVDEPDSPYRYTPGRASPEPLLPVNAEIRRVIKDGSLGRQALTNLYLFTASRAEAWHTILQPALERGFWVIAARNHISTLVYQGAGEGVDARLIQNTTAAATGERYMHPDHAYVLDFNDEAARAARISGRGELETPDTFESKDAAFQRRVLESYRSTAAATDTPIIDVTGMTPHDVVDALWRDITQ